MSKENKEYPLEDLLVNIQPGFARKPTKSGNMVHLRTNNISPDGTLDLSSFKYISASSNEVKKYSLTEGDVLFNNTNSDIWVGKTAYIDRPLTFLYSNHLTRLRADKTKVNPQYLAIYLHKLQREGYFKSISTRWVNQTAVNSTSLRRLVLKIPSLEKQRSTIAIITQASNLRQKREQANQMANKLLQAVFLQMFGDPVTNPLKWEKAKVIDVAKCIVPGRNKPKSFSGNIPWITTTDLNHLMTTYESRNNLALSQAEVEEVRARIVPKGSVLMTCLGDLGIVSLAGKDLIINQQLHSFQCSNLISNTFLMFALSLEVSYMYKVAHSTVVPYMNKTNCNSIPIILPPIEMQNRFAAIVIKMEQLIIRQKQSEKSIDKLFDSIMSKAFKGELVAEVAP